MNKDGLGTLVGTKLGISKKDGIAAVEVVFESIREGLKTEGAVEIFKELKLEVVKTEARTAKNPQTGADVPVPEGQKVKIKQLKNFKDLV